MFLLNTIYSDIDLLFLLCYNIRSNPCYASLWRSRARRIRVLRALKQVVKMSVPAHIFTRVIIFKEFIIQRHLYYVKKEA